MHPAADVESTYNSKYIIDPKKRKRLLLKKMLVKYIKRYIIPAALLYMSLLLLNMAINLEIPTTAILIIILLIALINIEYDASEFMIEDASYITTITLKTKHGVYKLPNNLLLLAMPYVDKIIEYIKETKRHNLLFKTYLENILKRNAENNKVQEIIFYACNFCTRLILDVDKRMIIETGSYISFDVGFLSGFDYYVNIYSDSGLTIEEMPEYKIKCFKSTISKAILDEDIDLLCHNNSVSVFDFLRSFFFIYWLTQTYLLYDINRKILV